MKGAQKEFLTLSDFAYKRLRDRLDGLTDEEYLWEPALDCWTIRPNGQGKFRADWGLIFDEEPPVTTMAWRLGHIIDCLAGERCGLLLGLEPEPNPLKEGHPPTAGAALEMLERAHDLWRGYVSATDEAKLGDALGPRAGQYAEETRAAFVLHILDELIHHGAEVGVLRDLYRAERSHDPTVSALLRGDASTIDPDLIAKTITEHPDLTLRAAAEARWDAIPLMIDLGFPIDGRDGRTPLHHAAADGRLDLVKQLVELGSDLDAKDPIYNATPKEWAEYFSRIETADYLRSLAK